MARLLRSLEQCGVLATSTGLYFEAVWRDTGTPAPQLCRRLRQVQHAGVTIATMAKALREEVQCEADIAEALDGKG
jgi:hypothetical protein